MGRFSFKPKEIISAVLVFAVLVALISGIAVITTKKDKKIAPSVFSRGALDGSGKHVDTDTCLYTEELIQCRGLNVAVDFEAKLEYEIYFYRSDESFIGSTGRLTEDYVMDGYDNAKYCRIVIIPELKDGAEKIRFWEIRSYAKQITVRVDKDQSFEPTFSSLFPGIRAEHFASPTDFDEGYTVILQDSPFVLDDLDMFSGRTISKIWVPVSVIKDPTQDMTFTVYVLEGDGSARFNEKLSKTLTIKGGTLKDLKQIAAAECVPEGEELAAGQYRECYLGWYKVQQWVCFDVELKLGAGQTLGFSSATDTIAFAYSKPATDGPFYNDAFDTPALINNISIYFDVEVMD